MIFYGELEVSSKTHFDLSIFRIHLKHKNIVSTGIEELIAKETVMPQDIHTTFLA